MVRVVLCWLFCTSLAFAQTEKPFGFHFTSKGQKIARIPIDVQANLVILKVTIDQSDTLQFILDTGVSSTIITDPKIADKIGFQYVRTVQVSGAGEVAARCCCLCLAREEGRAGWPA